MPIATETTRAIDIQLVDRTLQGDKTAFDELVRKYQGRLYNTLVHILGCPADAEDVVQDALVQAYVKLHTFKKESAFFTWLYRLAVNRALTHRRRRKPTVSLDDEREMSALEPVAESAPPVERMLREERGSLVPVALAKLSEESRAVLVLREIEQLDYGSIANILGINVGTVRSRLHRARTQMRRFLRGSLPEFARQREA